MRGQNINLSCHQWGGSREGRTRIRTCGVYLGLVHGWVATIKGCKGIIFYFGVLAMDWYKYDAQGSQPQGSVTPSRVLSEKLSLPAPHPLSSYNEAQSHNYILGTISALIIAKFLGTVIILLKFSGNQFWIVYSQGIWDGRVGQYVWGSVNC